MRETYWSVLVSPVELVWKRYEHVGLELLAQATGRATASCPWDPQKGRQQTSYTSGQRGDVTGPPRAEHTAEDSAKGSDRDEKGNSSLKPEWDSRPAGDTAQSGRDTKGRFGEESCPRQRKNGSSNTKKKGPSSK